LLFGFGDPRDSEIQVDTRAELVTIAFVVLTRRTVNLTGNFAHLRRSDCDHFLDFFALPFGAVFLLSASCFHHSGPSASISALSWTIAAFISANFAG